MVHGGVDFCLHHSWREMLASLQSNKTLFIFQLKAFVGRSSLEAVASSNLATVTDQWILVSTAAGIHIIFRKCNFAHAHRSHSLSRALTAPAHSSQKKIFCSKSSLLLEKYHVILVALLPSMAYSYLHNKPTLGLFMKQNRVTLSSHKSP